MGLSVFWDFFQIITDSLSMGSALCLIPLESKEWNMKPKRIMCMSWNLMKFSQLQFKITQDQWLFLLPFTPFGMRISITVSLCLFHHCILEADSLFSFLGSLMEAKLSWDSPYSETYLGRFWWWYLWRLCWYLE